MRFKSTGLKTALIRALVLVLLAFAIVEGAFQARDRIAAACDPVAASSVGPLRDDAVLVVGGRAAVGLGQAIGWPDRVAGSSTDRQVRCFVRARLGLSRLLIELPALLAESRPAAVVMQVGHDEMFDDRVIPSEIEERRSDGYGFRWHLPAMLTPAESVPSIVGTWNAGPIEMSVFADGTARIGDAVARWAQDEGELQLVHADGTVQQMSLRIVDDLLMLRFGGASDEVHLERGDSSETMLQRAQRRMNAGDLVEAGLLLDSLRAQREAGGAMAMMSNELDALEGRAELSAPQIDAGPPPADLTRLEQDLRRLVAMCRAYGATPILVDGPAAIEALDRLLAQVAESTSTQWVAVRPRLDAADVDGPPTRRGVDCTARGHEIVARCVADALRALAPLVR